MNRYPKLNCEMKDCDYYDKEKDQCSSIGLWGGCQDPNGWLDYWNYIKSGEFAYRIWKVKA